jgi:hypothetical protein
MSWNTAEKTILASAVEVFNRNGFDVRRDVYMIFKRFRQESAHDLFSLCRFAAAVAAGRPRDGIVIGRLDDQAARTVAAYIYSFPDSEAYMVERADVSRLLEAMVESVTALDEAKRSNALASIVRRAVKEKSVDLRKRPTSSSAATPAA